MIGFFRLLLAPLVGFALLVSATLPVMAQGRLALILESTNAEPARQVKAALTEAGYSVVDPGVVNRDGIGWAVDVFRRKLERTGPGSVAIIYVRATGLSQNGANYILANSARPDATGDIADEGYPVSDLFRAFSNLRDSDIAVVLDVCGEDGGNGPTAFDAPHPDPPRLLIADCRSAQAEQDAGSSMADDFAGAILTPGLTLAEVVARTDRGGPLQTTGTSSGPPPGTSTAPAGSGQDSSLEEVLWGAIAETEDDELLEEFLTRFPDGNFAAQAQARLTAIRAAKVARTKEAPVDEDTPVGGKVAGIVVKKQNQKTAPFGGLSALSAPVSDGNRFTGTMSGTDATGWGNLYKNDCGAAIGYRLVMHREGETWRAELTRQTDGMTMHFSQRDRPRDNGVVLLYAASEGAKVTLKVRPGHAEKATYSIPTAGIGSCAIGYLY